VSTEDQGKRETIQNQLDFLRRYLALHELPVADEYVGDGVSGAIQLGDRPETRRLVLDAEADRIAAAVGYKLSRIGRKLSIFVDAHDALASRSVSMHSGTELFDPSTPAGMTTALWQ
jgi:DNA invertase Pin-like site-specific DNA recombinase